MSESHESGASERSGTESGTESGREPGHEPGAPRDLRGSHHDASGDMGVSSEREGEAGPGQQDTDGVRDTTPPASAVDPEVDPGRPGEDVPPEQRPGAVETNPEGIPPKAGYSSKDPRSD